MLDPVGLGSCATCGRGRPGDLGEPYIMEARWGVEVEAEVAVEDICEAAEGVGEVVREEGEEEEEGAGEGIPRRSVTDLSIAQGS